MKNHLENMITEEVKMVKIVAIIVDEGTDVAVEVIIVDEEDVEEADEDEAELYKMDIWEKMVMMTKEIEEQVSHYYIFVGCVRLYSHYLIKEGTGFTVQFIYYHSKSS